MALYSGPMSKLLEQCELVRWTVRDPPFLDDHDGCSLNLLKIPRQLLRNLLLDAWRQRLVHEVHHRDDYSDLCGLQWPPSRHETRLSALEAARINSLREGAFVTGASQGRFDMVKGTACPTCNQPDTWFHRAIHCVQNRTLRQKHAGVIRIWPTVPRALSEHLLPGRNSSEVMRKQLFLALPDTVSNFYVSAFPHKQHDLFSDGSCLHPAIPALSRASWAVISATHAAVLSSGVVPGLIQNVDRAELLAAMSAIRWTWEQATSSTLWTDSAYVGTGISAILDANGSVSHATNEDVWDELTEYLLLLPEGAFGVQHVPAHRDPTAQPSEFDTWTATWNSWADRQARRSLADLPASHQQLFHNYEAEFFRSEELVDQFRAFHLDFAEQHAKPVEVVEDEHDSDVGRPPSLQRPLVEGGDWIDGLPVAWHDQWRASSWCAVFPLAILQRMVGWLQTERMRAEISSNFSWLELAAMLEGSNFAHPFLIPDGDQNAWGDLRSVAAHLHRPLTVAARIRFLRDLFKALDQVFTLGVPFCRGLNLASFRVHPPQSGVTLQISASTVRQGELLLSTFTLHRPVRTVNDLSRPL